MHNEPDIFKKVDDLDNKIWNLVRSYNPIEVDLIINQDKRINEFVEEIKPFIKNEPIIVAREHFKGYYIEIYYLDKDKVEMWYCGSLENKNLIKLKRR